jgi:hypothetical protein
MYPACGRDFWNGGGLGGSLNLIRQAMHGEGNITDEVPTSLDIVYCDIDPDIDLHKIRREVNRLFSTVNVPNLRRERNLLESTTQLHFGPEPIDEGLPMQTSPQDWVRNTWAFELVGQYQDVSVRFRYFSASYQQVMYYLYSTGWTLGVDDAILLGSNWRYYGEGGQNLHTIFQAPLSQFFDEETKVITQSTVRRYHQGFWESEMVH